MKEKFFVLATVVDAALKLRNAIAIMILDLLIGQGPFCVIVYMQQYRKINICVVYIQIIVNKQLNIIMVTKRTNTPP